MSFHCPLSTAHASAISFGRLVPPVVVAVVVFVVFFLEGTTGKQKYHCVVHYVGSEYILYQGKSVCHVFVISGRRNLRKTLNNFTVIIICSYMICNHSISVSICMRSTLKARDMRFNYCGVCRLYVYACCLVLI